MAFDFKKTMRETSDEELVKILTVFRDDYQEEAIDAAEKELQLRNLSEEKKEVYKNAAEDQREVEIKKSNEPLGMEWKILTLIFPMVITFILSGFYKSNGYDKKAKDLVIWTFFGFGSYLLLIIVLSQIL